MRNLLIYIDFNYYAGHRMYWTDHGKEKSMHTAVHKISNFYNYPRTAQNHMSIFAHVLSEQYFIILAWEGMYM